MPVAEVLAAQSDGSARQSYTRSRKPWLQRHGRGHRPESPRFYEEAAAIADAFDWGDGGKGDPFWSNAGRDYATCLTMHVRLRDGDDANLGTVLQLMMEHEEVDDVGRPTQGPRYTAAEMIATGQFPDCRPRRSVPEQRIAKNNRQHPADGADRRALAAVRPDTRRSLEERHRLERSDREALLCAGDPARRGYRGISQGLARLVLSCALNVIYRKAGDVRVNS